MNDDGSKNHFHHAKSQAYTYEDPYIDVRIQILFPDGLLN